MEIKKPGLSDRVIGLTEEPVRNKPEPANSPTTKRRYKAPRTFHYYTDKDKAAAPAHLQSNGGKVRRSARDLGIPYRTSGRWTHGGNISSRGREKYREIKEGLSSKLENIAYQLIDAIPDAIPNASLKDLGATLAVVIDKMRLLREEPTAISEAMDRRAMLESLIERTMKEFPGMTREEVIDIIRDVKPEAIKLLS